MAALPTFYAQVRQFKCELILEAVAAANGNRTHAAQRLGLRRSYLLKLVRELGVQLPPSHPERAVRAQPRGGAAG